MRRQKLTGPANSPAGPADRPLAPARTTASSPNSSSSAASPCAWTHASKCCRVVVIPASIGSTRCASAGPAPLSACVRCAFAVLFVIGGSLAPVVGTVCLSRRDSHADPGAVATQFSSSTETGTSPEALRQGLRDLGYVEGRNLVIEYRDAEGKVERLPALAPELVALNVDVIVAPGTPQALAAKQATRTIPIVFTAAFDPVTDGLVTSLARPGGNVTGLATLSSELVGKNLEQLEQAVPGVSRVAILWQPGGMGERTEKDMLKGVEVTARALGVRPQFVEA